MDDEALDIGYRQGLLVEDDLDGYMYADDDDDEDEEELADETEEFGDDFGGDPDVVTDEIQGEFDALLAEVEDADSAIATAKELYNLAVETYLERKEYLLDWMDEHIQEGDIPAWAGAWEDSANFI